MICVLRPAIAFASLTAWRLVIFALLAMRLGFITEDGAKAEIVPRRYTAGTSQRLR